MLDGRINRSHTCSDHNKTDYSNHMAMDRQHNQNNADQFYRNSNTDQPLVTDTVGYEP